MPRHREAKASHGFFYCIVGIISTTANVDSTYSSAGNMPDQTGPVRQSAYGGNRGWYTSCNQSSKHMHNAGGINRAIRMDVNTNRDTTETQAVSQRIVHVFPTGHNSMCVALPY